jgi:hypothetical protein
MTLMLPPLHLIPKPGYYLHYKHDPLGKFGNYAYFISGIGFHTEESGVWLLNYLPLYPEASVYQASLALGIVCYDNRPLEMWMSEVVVEGVSRQRFLRVTDESAIARYDALYHELYDRFQGG